MSELDAAAKVAAASDEHGNLDSLGEGCGLDYIFWPVGREGGATLDGRFTADVLRAIADHMDAHSEPESA